MPREIGKMMKKNLAKHAARRRHVDEYNESL
jgi:hypothetical protein